MRPCAQIAVPSSFIHAPSLHLTHAERLAYGSDLWYAQDTGVRSSILLSFLRREAILWAMAGSVCPYYACE